MDTKGLENRLNDIQKKAFEKVFGPLIVMASAGTGKTDVIALRAYNAFLKGIPLEKMLLLTFTNRAAKSMSNRIKEVMGEEGLKIKVSTFHGLCGFILREESRNLSIGRDFIIIDEEDSKNLMKEALIKGGLERKLYYNEEQFVMEYMRLAREYPFTDGKPLNHRKVFLQLVKDRNVSRSVFSFEKILIDSISIYEKLLLDYNLMDFTSLVVGTAKAFEDDKIRNRWRERYEWMELDEVQDTNKIEYKIIKNLYEAHGNIGIFGDIHQTIYEWRGSIPNEILSDFKRNNKDYLELRFKENYRSKKAILHGAESFLGHHREWEEVKLEEKIKVKGFKTKEEEKVYIYDEILSMKNNGISLSLISILCRTNKDGKEIGSFLENKGIPVFMIDKTRFFSRSEIKNALSYLKLMVNPKDVLSLKRINKELAEEFLAEKDNGYLDISSFLDVDNYKTKDPYYLLKEAFEKNNIVSFDVETTGLDVKSDKVIQIAAVRGGKDGVIEKFERLLKIDESVGDSYKVHKISDAMLFTEGVDPKKGIKDFFEFIGESVLIGHNVNYDISILKENIKYYDISLDIDKNSVYDTLRLVRNVFKDLDSYKLENLHIYLELNHKPTHNAMDDVITTIELLEKLYIKIEENKEKRKEVFRKYEDKFYPIARIIGDLKDDLKNNRPKEILHQGLMKSNLLDKYEKSPVEMEKLRELYRIFREYDNLELSALDSLIYLLEVASLGNDSDRLLKMKEQIPVITVHQAKGLEFETVFIYNATDNSFPSGLSSDEKRLKEEKRLFYVAITRPKKTLYITYSIASEKDGQNMKPSRFIHQIDRKYLDFK